MKNRVLGFEIFIIFVLVCTQAVLAAAPPPLPSSFYGIVKTKGENVSAGTQVTAWINDVQYASTTISMYEGDSVYSLDVPGDQPGTPDVEGGKPGDTVMFKVNGVTATETSTWQSGDNTLLNLTLTSSSGYNIFVPVILK